MTQALNLALLANKVNTSGQLDGATGLTGTVTSTGLSITNDGTISGLTVGKGGGSATSNTAVGASALASLPSSSYVYNTAIGYQALTTLNGGSQNTAVGYTAMAATTSGGANASFGDLSLKSNTTGGFNSALGSEALTANTTGSNNVAVGQKALQANTTASYNTAIGYQTLYANTTGATNTAVGYIAGYGITTGSSNVCLGNQAGTYSTAITTGTNNTIVGSYAYTTSVSATQQAVFGYNQLSKGDYTFAVRGDSGSYNSANTATWNVTSDQRLKKNIVDHTEGLDKVIQIRVRNFEYRLPEEVDAELKPTDAVLKEGVQLGIIAQELAEVLPDCVKTESTGVMSVNQDNITWHMINAIKDLKAELDTVKAELAALKG